MIICLLSLSRYGNSSWGDNGYLVHNRCLERANSATIGSRIYDSAAEMIFGRYNRSVMSDERASYNVKLREPLKEFHWLNDRNLGGAKKLREDELYFIPQLGDDHDPGGLDLDLSLNIGSKKSKRERHWEEEEEEVDSSLSLSLCSRHIDKSSKPVNLNEGDDENIGGHKSVASTLDLTI